GTESTEVFSLSSLLLMFKLLGGMWSTTIAILLNLLTLVTLVHFSHFGLWLRRAVVIMSL
ncbi:MAG: hypothetical protein H6Q44_693, partial [Deltaproteobacteria bacterium]|nr:hypothetical protein [Deltaproteobacteria bacterium]